MYTKADSRFQKVQFWFVSWLIVSTEILYWLLYMYMYIYRTILPNFSLGVRYVIPLYIVRWLQVYLIFIFYWGKNYPFLQDKLQQLPPVSSLTLSSQKVDLVRCALSFLLKVCVYSIIVLYIFPAGLINPILDYILSIMEVKNKAGDVQQQGLTALFFNLIVYLTTVFSRWWETAMSFKENISNPELWRLFISSIPCITVIEDDQEEEKKKDE